MPDPQLLLRWEIFAKELFRYRNSSDTSRLFIDHGCFLLEVRSELCVRDDNLNNLSAIASHGNMCAHNIIIKFDRFRKHKFDCQSVSLPLLHLSNFLMIETGTVKWYSHFNLSQKFVCPILKEVNLLLKSNIYC